MKAPNAILDLHSEVISTSASSATLTWRGGTGRYVRCRTDYAESHRQSTARERHRCWGRFAPFGHRPDYAHLRIAHRCFGTSQRSPRDRGVLTAAHSRPGLRGREPRAGCAGPRIEQLANMHPAKAGGSIPGFVSSAFFRNQPARRTRRREDIPVAGYRGSVGAARRRHNAAGLQSLRRGAGSQQHAAVCPL